MINKSYVVIGLLAVLSGLGSGCAVTRDRINLRYARQQGISKLEGAEQVALSVTLLDTRISSSDKVGRKKNGFGMEMAGIYSNVDVAALVSKAIIDELRMRGFKVDGGSTSLGIELTKFENYFKAGFFSADAEGEVSFSVQVKKPDGGLKYAKTIVGFYVEKPIFVYNGKNAKKALEGALKDATTKLMQDDGFIQALLQSTKS